MQEEQINNMMKELKNRKNQSMIENGIQADLRKVMNESFGMVRSSVSTKEFHDRQIIPPNINTNKKSLC